MNVIVDTSVWSLALRRKEPPNSSPAIILLQNLITDDQVVLLGSIRQEILSGIRSSEQFAHLKNYLRAFPNLELMLEGYQDKAGQQCPGVNRIHLSIEKPCDQARGQVSYPQGLNEGTDETQYTGTVSKSLPSIFYKRTLYDSSHCSGNRNFQE